MIATVTKDLFATFLRCKYKAHLLHTNCAAVPADFVLSDGLDADFHATVRHSLLASFTSRDLPSIPSLASDLKRGYPILFDVELDVDDYHSVIQSLKKVPGASRLGDFHYEPMIFCRATRLDRSHKLLLAFDAFLLGNLQGRMPDYGSLIQGLDFHKSRVRLSQQIPAALKIIRQLRDQIAGNLAPVLVLNPHCNACMFGKRCMEEATANDSLSLLQGVTEKEIARCKRKGIFTLTQLSYTFRPRRRPKWAKENPRPHSFALQALAVRENKVYINGKPCLRKAATRIFFDIEGVPDRGFYYLIGVLIDSGTGQETHSFWADDEAQQVPMITQFIQLLSGYPDYVLYHFGNYDAGALRHLKSRISGDFRIPFTEVQKRAVNVLSIIHPQIYFPVLANTLKKIAGHLGFRWTDEGATGLHSIAWREQWDRTHDPALKERLVRYNLDDCLALKTVTEFIMSLENRMSREATVGDGGLPEVVNTNDLPRSIGRSHRFGKISFVFPELEFVNKCAYFDYQREKVFVRTNKALRRIKSRPSLRRKKTLRPNTHVELLCARCPACGTRKIAGKPICRTIVDLRFSTGGVRRWITKYQAEAYRCKKCGKSFLPEGFPSGRDKYGHGLKSWFAHQIIVGGQDAIKVTRGARDIFGLEITTSYHRFKHSLATYYSNAYSGTLEVIRRGGLVHIDETEVAMKGRTEKGYVWVFASMEGVYYFYKESRKGDFLEEMLRGFSGVVVSDFFTAYDSLKCPQQKCVIHLLRDINEDLLRNPFDEELRTVVQPFASLFRTVIDTVDRFGLKRRHLQKHKSQALEFIDAIRQDKLTSDCAVKYQKKFEKYGPRLFTFLDHDGVPWNNNNAEHALKKFVKYRRSADGRFTEKSLGSHLVLLSVMESCEYQGIPVLRFLLSRTIELSRDAMRRAEKAARTARRQRNIGRKRR